MQKNIRLNFMDERGWFTFIFFQEMNLFWKAISVHVNMVRGEVDQTANSFLWIIDPVIYPMALKQLTKFITSTIAINVRAHHMFSRILSLLSFRFFDWDQTMEKNSGVTFNFNKKRHFAAKKRKQRKFL